MAVKQQYSLEFAEAVEASPSPPTVQPAPFTSPSRSEGTCLRISAIIPVLNEEQTLPHLLHRLKQMSSELEIIVVDGGSTDRTVQIAREFARVLPSAPGRAVQMNAGARWATGDVFWFLHADSRPHPRSLAAIRQAMRHPRCQGGAFQYAMDGSGWIYRVSEFFSNRKNRLLQVFYGDMGIFVRKDAFRRLRGYRPIPLMEDLDFCLRLRQLGKVVILPETMITSSRRWQIEGPIKTIVRNWMLQIAWLLGASPDRLRRWYTFPQNGGVTKK